MFGRTGICLNERLSRKRDEERVLFANVGEELGRDLGRSFAPGEAALFKSIRLSQYAGTDPPPTSRTKVLARVPFGLLGCDVAECRVDALPIVVAFDVGEQVASGLVPGRPSSLVNEFDPESMEEAFHGSVVVTAACPAHGGRRLHVGELFVIGLGRVLLGFKRSSQHHLARRPAQRRAPLPASSSSASCAVGC